MFLSKRYPSEPIIDETNVNFYAPDSNVIINGEHFSRGLELPFAKSYEGSAFTAPFSKPIIPRNEWAARIEEREKNGSLTSQIVRDLGVPTSNQNSTNYCHTSDTEVLTDKGWKNWVELKGNELLGTMNPINGFLEFQLPLEYHTFEYKGPIIYCDHKSQDFGVTPEHRMLVKGWRDKENSGGYSFCQAKDMLRYVTIPHATFGFKGVELVKIKIEGMEREYAGDDFIQLLAYICADGWVRADRSRVDISFCCFDADRYDDAAKLAWIMGFGCETNNVWTLYNGALAEWVRANCYTSSECGAVNKRIPDIIKCASSRQIQLFLNYFGDRTHTGEIRRFYSCSKKLIDDLQELLLRVGVRGSIGETEARTGREYWDERSLSFRTITGNYPEYSLYEKKRDFVNIDREKHLNHIQYNGTVHCATVPNGILVTRRNDSILISGNCWTYGVVTALNCMRARRNLPYVEFSRESVAAPIKGYRNNGGWGLEAIEYMAEYGIMEQSLWPRHYLSSNKYRTEANLSAAAQYKVQLFLVLQDRNFSQLMTSLLDDDAVAVGYNWWRHEVCAIDPVIIGSNAFGIRIWNSWGDSYGDRGMAILAESKATPDDAVIPVI